MRGNFLRAVPVCLITFATGCFMFNGMGSERSAAVPRTETHAYWQKVNEILSRRARSQDISSMVQLVREQTNALRALSPEGVDETLVAAVEEVVRCEDKVLEIADISGDNAENLKQSRQMAILFVGANKKATDAKEKVRGLRDELNARYDGGFAVMQK